MRRTACVAAYAVLWAALGSGCAGRTDPGVVLPTRGARAPADRSKGGHDRGDVEIALGAVTVGVAATLVVLGAVSLAHGQQLQRQCSQPTIIDGGQSSSCSDILGFDPVRGARISGGLALALSVPIAVGGGLLLRKGVRIRRDWQRQRRAPAGLSLRPWLMGQSAGLDLGFKF
jgi:hypothetical protein